MQALYLGSSYIAHDIKTSLLFASVEQYGNNAYWSA